VNQQDRQAIEELFQHLYKWAAEAGPRDPEAEALIQQRFQQGPPGLLYHMAQTIVGQQHTLREARAQLAGYQRQGGAPAGFAPPGPRGAGQQGYPPYGQPPPYQPYQQQSGRPGFLAGAGKIALGVGGGILGAEALSGLFGEVFGGDRDDYDRDRDWGDRDDYRDGGDYGGQDPGSGYDNSGYDNSGDDDGFGGGGFDDGGGGGW
jgi:hypothetical protein